MSSNQSIPTVVQMLDAFAVGTQTKHDVADAHDGADYDVLGGMGALIWSRASVRDREIFHGIYLDGCQRSAMDDRIQRLGGPARIVAKKGTGTALLACSSPASITVYVGTRIAVSGPSGTRFYRIAEDLQASNVSSLHVAIEAEDEGKGVAVDSYQSSFSMRWEDLPSSSSEWTIVDLRCEDGTVTESDTEYLARFREWKRTRRPGYAEFITRKMLNCGASEVVLFESNTIEQADYGINRVFVNGPGNVTTPELLKRCRLAIDSSVAFGCTTTVGSMVRLPISVAVRLRMFRRASTYDTASLTREALKACQRALGGNLSAYVFRRDALQAELFRAFPDLQETLFESPTPSDTDLTELIRTGAGGQLSIYDASRLSVDVMLEGVS